MCVCVCIYVGVSVCVCLWVGVYVFECVLVCVCVCMCVFLPLKVNPAFITGCIYISSYSLEPGTRCLAVDPSRFCLGDTPGDQSCDPGSVIRVL